MPYLIDGHNLIGRMPGLSLSQPDDEDQLINWVTQYCNAVRRPAEIYFDNASPGLSGRKKYGRVTAVYVLSGSTADAAIRRRLKQLKGAARTWTVVSSDRQVQAEARNAGAAVVESGAFAHLMDEKRMQQAESGETEMDAGDIAGWLAAFGADPEE